MHKELAKGKARKATRDMLAMGQGKGNRVRQKVRAKADGEGLRSPNSTSEGQYARINEEDIDWEYGSPLGGRDTG